MKRRKNRYITLYIITIYILSYSIFVGYRIFYSEKVASDKKTSIYIPFGSTVENVIDTLLSKKVILNIDKFRKHVVLSGYSTVKGGHYVVKKNMTYRKLVEMLYLGQQTPVNLVISGNIRTKDRLAGIISKQIEADSGQIIKVLNDSVFLRELGFNLNNATLLFLPNTYNVYWNRDVKQLFRDMKREYDKFWNQNRIKKLQPLKLTKEEVMVLASIIIEESAKYDELPRIAGVYVNRLHAGMPLQADPTVKYAIGDFALKRILTVHTEYDSPYNTYRYKGLPPGPICIPNQQSIDATLNYEQHDYLYFCAKDDFSGYHVFAKTLHQHNQNANAYRNALNKRKIY